jgi:hypothetical protein
MVTSQQRDQLLLQAVFGVELEIATDMLGISIRDLQMNLLCDESFDISLALAQEMRSEFATALYNTVTSR